MKKNYFKLLLASLVLLGFVISLTSWDVLEDWDPSDTATQAGGGGGSDDDTDPGTDDSTKIYRSPVEKNDCPSTVTTVTSVKDVTTAGSYTSVWERSHPGVTVSVGTTVNISGTTVNGLNLSFMVPIFQGKKITQTINIPGGTRTIENTTNTVRKTRVACIAQVVPVGTVPLEPTCTAYDCEGKGTTYQNN